MTYEEERAAEDARERAVRKGKLVRIVKWSVLGTVAFVGLLTAWSGLYTVPEGHITVVKKFSEAVRQENPGLQFKIPFIETTETFEVRERKNVEEMSVATANQLPATAVVSINWTVNKEAALNLYVRYGGLAQFEDRVLDPRMRSAAKAAISRFRADQLIRERQLVVAEIQKEILTVMAGLPITVNTTQLEDIELPEIYMQSILAKEKAREDAEREKHNLTKQKLEAQQLVQSAEAERDAVRAHADGQAYKIEITALADAKQVRIAAAANAERITVEADAEAYRINIEYTGRSTGVKRLAAELTPEYVQYLLAQQWDGVRSRTVLGASPEILMQIGD